MSSIQPQLLIGKTELMPVNEHRAELVWAIQLRPDCLAVADTAPDSSAASLGTAPPSHLEAAIAPISCSCS